MMHMNKFSPVSAMLALALLLTTAFSAAGQKKQCAFTIDTLGILSNSNLDYFVSKLNTDSFVTLKSKKAIPAFIMDQLNCLTRKFSLANPNEDYQCCCTSSESLPMRKLLYLAVSKDVFVATYLTGGVGVTVHILFIKFSGKNIEDIWTGFSFDDLKSKAAILGYIKKNRHKHWGLNTNMVYL